MEDTQLVVKIDLKDLTRSQENGTGEKIVSVV